MTGAGPSKTSPALDLLVEGLTVEFDGGGERRTAVSNVSFSVRSGQFVGIVGETGSGKSVMLRSLLRLLPPSGRTVAGRALLGDLDLLRASERQLRLVRGAKIGFIPQQPWSALNPILPIGRQFHGVAKAHLHAARADRQMMARTALRRVEISDPDRVLASVAGELSGGLAQRVAMAMVLQLDPPLIVADEPTTALDLTVQLEVLDLLATLCRADGRSVLIVTHDIGIVAQFCDEVVVMRRGAVVESGRVDEVFAAPRSDYTRELLEAAR